MDQSAVTSWSSIPKATVIGGNGTDVAPAWIAMSRAYHRAELPMSIHSRETGRRAGPLSVLPGRFQLTDLPTTGTRNPEISAPTASDIAPSEVVDQAPKTE